MLSIDKIVVNKLFCVERALLRAATRDSDDLAVDPSTIVRRQEADDASDVLGSGAAAERAVLGHHLLDVGGGDVRGAAGDVCLVNVSEIVRENSITG
jgi:hypothetical protein